MPDSYHLNWNAEALWQRLEPLLPGLSIEVVARTDSTNSQLIERGRRASGLVDGPLSRPGEFDTRPAELGLPRGADLPTPLGRRAGDAQPALLVAEHQTRGRGRLGKSWQSSAGASLTFSLSLPMAPAHWSGLSLAVGLALADALDPPLPRQALRLGIKWPNDLMLVDAHGGDPSHDRKIGGILIETLPVGHQRLAVIGIGLNVLPQPVKEPSWGYACLQEIDYGITAPQALARVAEPLVRALLAFEADGFAPLQARFAARDRLAGQAVSTTLAETPEGIADGVDDEGALWLRVGDQRHRLASGEVSLRRPPSEATGPTEPAPC
jgi:BirA family biotin operon repressor/biotin-[acetyl-CoA-carboxylase] ligase